MYETCTGKFLHASFVLIGYFRKRIINCKKELFSQSQDFYVYSVLPTSAPLNLIRLLFYVINRMQVLMSVFVIAISNG